MKRTNWIVSNDKVYRNEIIKIIKIKKDYSKKIEDRDKRRRKKGRIRSKV